MNQPAIELDELRRKLLHFQRLGLELSEDLDKLGQQANLPQKLFSLDEIAELCSFSRDKVENLVMYNPALSPEDVALMYGKIQTTKIGGEYRISQRAYNAWVALTQGQHVETKRMSKKAKVLLAKK